MSHKIIPSLISLMAIITSDALTLTFLLNRKLSEICVFIYLYVKVISDTKSEAGNYVFFGLKFKLDIFMKIFLQWSSFPKQFILCSVYEAKF